MALLTVSRVVTPALILLGGYCLHGFSTANGLFPAVESLKSKHQLPSSGSLISKPSFPNSFTGLDPPDGILATLLLFFWPLLDGANPGASLFSFLFAGQGVALLSAIVLEASRKANKGRIISFTTVYGILFQCLGAGLVAPLYLTIYLFTSPLVTSAAALTPAALFIDEGLFTGHIFGVSLGYIVPTVLMTLPQPDVLPLDTKITAIVLWQLFPIWTSTITYVTKLVVGSRTPSANQPDAQTKQISMLRTVYKLSLAVSVPTHIAGWTLSLSTMLLPNLFNVQTVQEFHPLNVFVPPNPFSDVKIGSVAQGSHWFLQYDYVVTAAAYLLWASASRYAVGVKNAKGDSGGFGIGAFLDIIGRCVLMGPYSAALTLLWDRDEAVFTGANQVAGKKTA
ncbi:hypothetical protein LTR10_019646 [Elasticomyces elasticus]|uniref:Uncharacterized protein n=1 Tax=Exophiala sideris TaxID=1016849 RepID=A0ABR0JGF5_9EURO|nr:hypothetical protein LTR10_019646 [Elasticomyces elasticus]KAK5025778.1 hypothetical protein LTS07_007982 [Exophiala sideris]KAK5033014.1 hypothetical protein LTR13_006979 [Exophiala sideris]KAK5063499.1 hypothetical protein LTR69_004205 [Exophiala sideris]KAK5180669.1 hypothetical protein LTR44_006983 [Eurotiomycetes sp. CCFEE 6388]